MQPNGEADWDNEHDCVTYIEVYLEYNFVSKDKMRDDFDKIN